MLIVWPALEGALSHAHVGKPATQSSCCKLELVHGAKFSPWPPGLGRKSCKVRLFLMKSMSCVYVSYPVLAFAQKCFEYCQKIAGKWEPFLFPAMLYFWGVLRVSFTLNPEKVSTHPQHGPIQPTSWSPNGLGVRRSPWRRRRGKWRDGQRPPLVRTKARAVPLDSFVCLDL